MTRPRILLLGNYPATHPRHGGQIRLAQIMAAYQAHGFEVRQASFFPANSFYLAGGLGPADVALPPDSLQSWHGQQAPLIEDLASGELVAGDVKKLEALERFAGQVDVVHLEQPWLLPVVHQLRARGRLGAFRLVYGSQNVEHPLKQAIFKQYAVRGEPLIEAIHALEKQCAGEADLVVAVTQEDAAQLASWTQAPVVLAPNGVAPWTSTERARARWRERTGGLPFALYVASAHPPNVVGLCESFGECLAALSPLQTLVVAGGASEHIANSAWFQRWGSLNERRMLSAGVLEEDELSALRDLAHVFVLPMTSGGGSNLKTAEALYTGRHVVATPLAMRGFEAMQGLRGLAVVQPGTGFGKAVSRALGQPQPAGDPESDRLRQGLTWAHTLEALCAAVGALNKERA